MTKREMTCIICPMGCSLTVELEGEEIRSISGNTCRRGDAYARAEVSHPQRTVTSTMRCDDGGIVSVKTDRPIPKAKIMDCMALINAHVAGLPVSVGEVLLRDVFGSNIIATENRAAARG